MRSVIVLTEERLLTVLGGNLIVIKPIKVGAITKTFKTLFAKNVPTAEEVAE